MASIVLQIVVMNRELSDESVDLTPWNGYPDRVILSLSPVWVMVIWVMVLSQKYVANRQFLVANVPFFTMGLFLTYFSTSCHVTSK